MPDAPFEANREIAYRRRVVAFVAFAVVGASFVALAAVVALRTAPAPAVVLLFLFGVPTLLFMLAGSWRSPSKTRCRVRVDARGVFADERLVLARDEIHGAYFQPRSTGRPHVRIQSTQELESVAVDVIDEAEGMKLLAALAVDASRSATGFRVRRGIFENDLARQVLGAALTPAIVARVRAGLLAFADFRIDDATPLVGRRARPYDAWIEALRALGRDAQYRVANVPREGLWQILENPAAEVSARVGAAMALRPSLDDEGRARLRVASAASASPHVRVGFDAIARAETDDAAIREALEACDENASNRGTRG